MQKAAEQNQQRCPPKSKPGLRSKTRGPGCLIRRHPLRNAPFRPIVETGLLGGFLVAAAEFLNAAGDVDQFLFAGDERVAFGADTDFLFFAGGVDVPDFAAGADDLRRTIRGMDGIFHF